MTLNECDINENKDIPMLPFSKTVGYYYNNLIVILRVENTP